MRIRRHLPLQSGQRNCYRNRSSIHLTVGADAHIGPAECTDFTGISGEGVTSQRADVGIGPYNPVNRIATEIEAAFISSEKPYDSKNAAAVKMTDS